MSKTPFRDHMMNQFSLLDKKKKLIVDDQIENNQNDKKISESIDKELTGKNIPIPKMDHLADTIWALRQAQPPQYFDKLSTSISTSRLVKRKKIIMRTGSILAAAAAVTIIFITGIFKIAQKPQTIAITLTMGNAKIIPGGKKLKNNTKYILKSGDSILTSQKTKVIALMPGNGKFELKNSGKITLLDLQKKTKSNSITLSLDRGHVLVSIDKSSYKNFKINTPHSIVTVTGTIFELSVNSRKTSVKVQQGEVKCTLVSDNNKTIVLSIDDSADFIKNKIIPIKKNDQKKKSTNNQINKTNKASQKFRERVYLKNGMVITGSVISQNKTTLVVRTPAGIMRISRNKVKNVKYIK